MMLGKGDTVVLGTIGLNQDVSVSLPSPRPPSDLCEQLKQTLRGTKIRNGERRISRYDTYQGDVRIIMPFGNHLGAYQDIDVATAQGAQNTLMGRFSAGGIAV